MAGTSRPGWAWRRSGIQGGLPLRSPKLIDPHSLVRRRRLGVGSTPGRSVRAPAHCTTAHRASRVEPRGPRRPVGNRAASPRAAYALGLRASQRSTVTSTGTLRRRSRVRRPARGGGQPVAGRHEGVAAETRGHLDMRLSEPGKKGASPSENTPLGVPFRGRRFSSVARRRGTQQVSFESLTGAVRARPLIHDRLT